MDSLFRRCFLVRALTAALLLFTGARSAPAQRGIAAPLPPARPWHGKSEALVAAKDDPWITPAERSGFVTTPGYDETVSWLQKLCAAVPEFTMISLGKSPQGRDIWMVVASKEHAFTPAALRATGKPILLAQAGIHAGEIDGKDAGLLLLRDIGLRRRNSDLLEGANWLFVPIFNVDGHERFSMYGRINQRGPEKMGWRTNARNQNLNRDYAKADTPEMQAMLRAINTWQPDLYFDLHVTDGADYQYDLTFGYTGRHGYSPAIASWLDDVLSPALRRELAAMGHIPGPLVFPVNGEDFRDGIAGWTAPPRFSNGYGDARHLPTVLLENHSLKPYKQRVLGTYVFLETGLRVMAQSQQRLREAIAADRRRRPDEIVLRWKPSSAPPPLIDFLGIISRRDSSVISGATYVQWTGEPVTLRIPFVPVNEPAAKVRRPRAYYVPAAWPEVIARLRLHGIEMETLTEGRDVEVEMYRMQEARLGRSPFEGHVQVTATGVPEQRREHYSPGSVRIPTDQPLGELAAALLEPGGPDSFYQWGFFLEIMDRTEYAEPYVMEPLAARLLAEDAPLRVAFEARVAADSSFARSPRARLQWLYAHTPYFDDRWNLYPVARELR